MHLRAGVYFIDGPLSIPDGVQLRGESIELVSIFFREVASDAQSIGAQISGDSNAAHEENSTAPAVKPAVSILCICYAKPPSSFYTNQGEFGNKMQNIWAGVLGTD